MYSLNSKSCNCTASTKIQTQHENDKGKVYPITGHKGPEGEERYSSTLSLTSALDGVVINVTPRPLYPRERDQAPIV